MRALHTGALHHGAICSHAQAVTLKRHTLTGALAGKRRGVCCGRTVSVMITLLAFGISGAAPLTTVSATLRLAPCGVAALATENLETFLGVPFATGAAMAEVGRRRARAKVERGVCELVIETLRIQEMKFGTCCVYSDEARHAPMRKRQR